MPTVREIAQIVRSHGNDFLFLRAPEQRLVEIRIENARKNGDDVKTHEVSGVRCQVSGF
jgi:hypothetical protein